MQNAIFNSIFVVRRSKNTSHQQLLIGTLFICLLLPVWSASASVPLESYNVDPKSVTISGLSSGGAMAMQFHVAFSKDIRGAGIFAGLPYACGKEYPTATCEFTPEAVSLNTLIMDTHDLASEGKIDSTFNLNNVPVYIFHGARDSIVLPGNGRKIEEFYSYFGAKIKSVLDMAAEHGYPTDFYGAPCNSSSAGFYYINNCDYHGAFIMLQHLYASETLVKPTKDGSGICAGELLEFNQTKFIDALSPLNISMGAEGFIYVPSQCKNKESNATCKFHVAFHGCTQSKTSLGDIFVTKTGYLEVAELNNIIVLFPQAAPNSLVDNEYGCWDWHGYLNDANFLNQEGAQMKAVFNMVKRIVNQN